ncbi:hypothetical protein [Streptomyces sp. CC208A]|uniref:hypothetical protein n=1 Tax=Streptomyces sp. CC208A TaxID=3044573 RepID=UPI0024A98997|nr:hypothetical protein [Streptomyces sp. CC208A]
MAGSLLAGCGGDAPPDVPEAACWGAFKQSDMKVLIASGSEVRYGGLRTIRQVYPDGIGSSSGCHILVRGGHNILVLVERRHDRWSFNGRTWEGPGPDAAKVTGVAEFSKASIEKYVSCDRSAFHVDRIRDSNKEKTVRLRISTNAPETEENRAALASMMRDLEAYFRSELACA